MDLITKVVDYSNINRAFKRVVSNKGSKGVDGITTKELHDYMQENWSRAERKEIVQWTILANEPDCRVGKRLQLGIIVHKQF